MAVQFPPKDYKHLLVRRLL